MSIRLSKKQMELLEANHPCVPAWHYPMSLARDCYDLSQSSSSNIFHTDVLYRTNFDQRIRMNLIKENQL